jgi:hypothetical protein
MSPDDPLARAIRAATENPTGQVDVLVDGRMFRLASWRLDEDDVMMTSWVDVTDVAGSALLLMPTLRLRP